MPYLVSLQRPISPILTIFVNKQGNIRIILYVLDPFQSLRFNCLSFLVYWYKEMVAVKYKHYWYQMRFGCIICCCKPCNSGSFYKFFNYMGNSHMTIYYIIIQKFTYS